MLAERGNLHFSKSLKCLYCKGIRLYFRQSILPDTGLYIVLSCLHTAEQRHRCKEFSLPKRKTESFLYIASDITLISKISKHCNIGIYVLS